MGRRQKRRLIAGPKTHQNPAVIRRLENLKLQMSFMAFVALDFLSLS
jgi:hypothetical protein